MHFAHVITLTSWLKVSQVRISLHPHAIHDVTCLSVRLLVLVLSLFSLSLTSTFSLSQSTCSLYGTPSSMSSPPRVKTTALAQHEEYFPVAIYNPLTTPTQMKVVKKTIARPQLQVAKKFFEVLIFRVQGTKTSEMAVVEIGAHSCRPWTISGKSMRSRWTRALVQQNPH